MVQVEEVAEQQQYARAGAAAEDRESDYETDSNVSDAISDVSDDEDYFDPNAESLYDRVVALKEMVSPHTRSQWTQSVESARDWALWGWFSAGSVAWVVSTSALLVGLPLALAIEDETRIVQQEREMQMQSQGQQQVSAHVLGYCGRCRPDRAAFGRTRPRTAGHPSARILGGVQPAARAGGINLCIHSLLIARLHNHLPVRHSLFWPTHGTRTSEKRNDFHAYYKSTNQGHSGQ